VRPTRGQPDPDALLSEPLPNLRLGRRERQPELDFQPRYYEGDQSLLRNPYMLAGLAVAAAIVLAVIVVIFFGSGSGAGNNTGNGAGADPLTPLPGRGVEARSIATATVREGPSGEYAEIGLLRSGQDVEVIGRNADASWFEIFFPPQSQLVGWVPNSALRVPEESLALIPEAQVTPIPRPTPPPQPTPPPEPTATETPLATETATPGGGVDLAIGVLNSDCDEGDQLVLSVANVGSEGISERLVRIVVVAQGNVIGTSDFSISLESGEGVNLPTNLGIQPPRTTARIDLLGSPQDINDTNNVVDCVVRGQGQAPP
jgi:hypothetical protein